MDITPTLAIGSGVGWFVSALIMILIPEKKITLERLCLQSIDVVKETLPKYFHAYNALIECRLEKFFFEKLRFY